MPAKAKNILALTVKIVRALQAYPNKVKMHKQAPLDLEIVAPASRALLANQNTPKMLASEIVKPPHHAVFVAVNNRNIDEQFFKHYAYQSRNYDYISY